jgi:hypothetical protein
MAEPQPSTVVEGATTGDVEDEVPPTAAKSAEDRKAAAAMAKLDTHGDESSGSAQNVDQEAVNKAMQRLQGLTGGGAAGGSSASNKGAAGTAGEKKEVKKVKVDAADVTLLVCTPRQKSVHHCGDSRLIWVICSGRRAGVDETQSDGTIEGT